MKKLASFLGIALAVSLCIACPKPEPPAEPSWPTTREAFVKANTEIEPGKNGYVFAVGSGPTADLDGIMQPYTCIGYHNGRQITFTCPGELRGDLP